MSRLVTIMDVVHVIDTPFGPMLWQPYAARKLCRGLVDRPCVVMIQERKPGGLCSACANEISRADRQEGEL